MTSTPLRMLVAVLAAVATITSASAAAGSNSPVGKIVTEAVEPVMKKYGIPGLAVGVVTPEGREIFTFGIASKDTRKPVTADTLFEIGSVSKTFTATLASYAAVKGELALTDPVTTYVPELKDSALDRVNLLNLATHTTGGMPLQFPDEVTNDAQLMDYFRQWTPKEKPGSSRTYANPSVGLLGLAAARAMKRDFSELMTGTVYAALGLKHTFLDVPKEEQVNYAQGYTKKDIPIRMSRGVLGEEAYGVRTDVGDLTLFVEANMGRIELDADMAAAIAGTQVGYYRLGAMTQALIWERYDYPAELRDLLAGNSADMASKPHPTAEIAPPAAPRKDVWINKTGSTNGFGAYVAFVPGRKIGIVILANKNYPNEARVTAAHQILTALDRKTGK